MPRFASRILLEITSVKPVKLHGLTGREGFHDLADMQAASDAALPPARETDNSRAPPVVGQPMGMGHRIQNAFSALIRR